MKPTTCILAAILTLTPMATTAKNKTVTLRILQTSDVHGCFFPYNFIERKPMKGTLARVSTYVNQLRQKHGSNVILLDNGDILQGQPTCYYSNYVKPEIPNVAAEVVNYLGYDAETMGNHDVETGHAVYDKWIKEVKCPMLGANIVDTHTGKPYVKPYTIVERDGVKVAILGLLTPAIPNWLSEELWSGLRFDEMVSCAKKWMDHLRKHEHPDVVVGLFHSGHEGGIVTEQYEEDASLRVAREVPGFDLVLFGHDHRQYNNIVRNVEGRDVVCLDPSSNALMVADATIALTMDKRGRVKDKKVEGCLTSVADLPVDQAYVTHFAATIDSIRTYVERPIGEFESTIYTRDCYFGNSAFSDFIHDLQLRFTGADISLNAPLSFDTHIQAGTVHMSDMFNLYRYENQLYVLRMTGEEVRKHLEMSYDLWVNTMHSPDDHIMLLSNDDSNDKQRFRFKNLAFNFDSACGIDYEVDVTKPDGEKVRILRMSNGQAFEPDKWYNVAMNSYRGNGGGELLTKGAGIPPEELKNRVIFRSERDQRYYLTEEIEKAGRLNPQAHHNWRFVPEEWTIPAIARDRQIIFGK
ncbi:MAG: 5'-nucleotidase C-terminal domain-containing protein [Prevotella sp.]|nr:5'-nucleotidase C-terminal domain-containing protein [Prevotella sp.]